MSLKQIVANNIKQLRTEKNLSQTEAAKMTGISSAYWGYLEKGERNPGLDVIEKISQAFNIRPYILLMENDTKNSPGLSRRIDGLVTLGDKHILFIIDVLDAYLKSLNNEKQQANNS